MSRRHSERVWLHDADEGEIAWARRTLETEGFWRYVDSVEGAGTYPREGDWVDERGSGCVAANSRREQCTLEPVLGLPFCGGHLDYAWTAILATVLDDRSRTLLRRSEADLALRLMDNRLAIEEVRDARRVLATKPEQVYFFAADHAVKIGRSINPEKRVRTLGGTKAPEGVDLSSGRLLGTIPGGCHVETALHREFQAHRLVGEWFDLGPIADAIAHLIGTAQERAA